VTVGVARPRRFAFRLCAAIVTAGAVLSASISVPFAAADPCPDIKFVFARGTGDVPAGGSVGQAFVDSLRSKVVPRSVGMYGVT
jgi:cutinase